MGYLMGRWSNLFQQSFSLVFIHKIVKYNKKINLMNIWELIGIGKLLDVQKIYRALGFLIGKLLNFLFQKILPMLVSL